MLRIKKNDTVVVLTGKDKGKQSTVIEVLSEERKVVVKGVNVATCHVKARKQGDVAGIKKVEKPVDVSNVMLFCSACKKPSRIRARMEENGKKVRVCNHCTEIV